ncbi:YegP family protein [Sphingomonas sp. HF-S4]|uniref:YegP family protein n=1 Tax=Sphingomonas agrestis TaxID=3080540 RepID=A0ABU3Y697_9SPHN|nr:YegP family protein [Sphingomonas sp. HF-S4]MDV3456894.1 YegP family protein [Sphingomonas sp. HF-S4]
MTLSADPHPFGQDGPADRIEQDLRPAGQAMFEIYRANRIKLTSILFSGEDWRWRFRSETGLVVASGDGFASERECRAAVDALRAGAGTAIVRELSVPG